MLVSEIVQSIVWEIIKLRIVNWQLCDMKSYCHNFKHFLSLGHELSSPIQTLMSWVPFSLQVSMYVSSCLCCPV
jgi:hypothetical protein